ncbi:MAG: hypothetical protein AAF489_03535 [Bacteroidota bacterium]
MKYVLIYSMLALTLITLLACSPDTCLNRETATAVLKDEFKPSPIYKVAKNTHDYDILVRHGYLKYDKIYYGGNLSQTSSGKNFELTKKGWGTVMKNHEGKGTQPVYDCRVGATIFNEITGVVCEPNSTTAEVHYTIKDTITEFGMTVFDYQTEVKEKIATFKRFDDGWKLVNLGNQN